jgi:tetratricopeptide (TPR) repeat protein
MQDSQTLAALFQQGLAFHQQGQHASAKAVYEQMLALQPQQADALHMLGVLALQAHGYSLAQDFIRASLQSNPANASAHLHLGLALKEMQIYDEALACFAHALALRPDYADAFNNQGVALYACKRYQEAIISLNQAIALNAGNASFLYNRALVFYASGQYEAALADFDKATSLQPSYAQAWNNRGVLLQDQSRLEEAIQSYAAAIASQPDFAQAHYNLGNALRALGRLEESIASYDRAIAIAPDFAHAFNNRGLALGQLRHSAQAIASYDAAIAIAGQFADAYWNKAIESLWCGDFAQGWKLYEWRWRRDSFSSRKRDFIQPLWLGDAPLAGKTVLLHAEQGLGDSIQFCRYVPLVQALGAKVLLEVPQPLMAVLATLDGVSQVLEKGSALPHFDLHCPLMSLPLAFQTGLDCIPAAVPYLASTAAQREVWHKRLGPKNSPRVGLVWSGNSRDKEDLQRSVVLSVLLPYLPPDVEYICLQKELRAVDQAALSASSIRFFGPQITDFSDTAALCDLMDVVISVDTSVAHLAGALAKPTWILLPFAADWRWMLDRNDSPWYPSANLYRQGDDRLWPRVLEKIRLDLIGLAKARH